MLGLIPLKDWVYLGLIVALISFGLYERAHLINEGENRCLAREREAAAQQAISDAKTNQEAIDALHNEMAGLLGIAGPDVSHPAHRVQCYASAVPAAPGKPGVAHAGEPAAAAGVVPSVPGGTGVGIEVGAGVQRLALSADIEAALHRACLKELKEP